MANTNELIGSIERALDILLLLQQEGEELGVTQISAKMGIYKSTVHRTLATLEKKGFVQQNAKTGKYWLGLKLYSMGMLIRQKLPLKNIAHPYAQALSERFNEVVHIAVLDKSSEDYPKQLIIDKIESQSMLSLTPPSGSISPAHCSAAGKCLLAFADPAYIRKFTDNTLPLFTANTIVSWEALLRELEMIRRSGYAIDNEELEHGLTCVAAPIFGANREIMAALSLSGPTARIRSERFQEVVDEVRKTTMLISAVLQ